MNPFKRIDQTVKNWWYYGLNEESRDILRRTFKDFFLFVAVVFMIAFVFFLPYLVHLSAPYVSEFFTNIFN